MRPLFCCRLVSIAVGLSPLDRGSNVYGDAALAWHQRLSFRLADVVRLPKAVPAILGRAVRPQLLV